MRIYLISIIHSLDILNCYVLGISFFFTILEAFVMSLFGQGEKEHESAQKGLKIFLGILFLSATLFVLIPSKEALEAIFRSLLD